MVQPQTSGTFTPTITFGSAAVGVGYSTQYGIWKKLSENAYSFHIFMQLSGLGSSTGAVQIEGLPFASVNAGAYVTPVNVHCTNMIGLTGVVQARIGNNSTVMTLRQTTATGADSIAKTECNTTAAFWINGTYFTD